MLIIWKWAKKIRNVDDTYAIYVLKEISINLKEKFKGFENGFRAYLIILVSLWCLRWGCSQSRLWDRYK